MSTDQITGTPSNVVLSGTGTYGNPVTIAYGAYVTGQPAVLAQDIRGIENDGTVAGTNTGIELKAGGSVTNTGTITGYKYGVVGDKNGAPSTITNQGYIGATTPQAFYSPKAWGVRLNAGGMITNTGTIAGYEGIGIRNATGSVDNAGTITAYDTGVSLGKQGGTVTNEATGTISSERNFGVYIQGNGTLDNSGLIQVQQYFAFAAVEMYGAGTVINHQGATIAAGGGAGVRMANYYSTPGTPSLVDNSGSISGFWGVYFNYGANGTLTNHATGSIFGQKYGVQMSDAGTVINYGTIAAGYYSGVRLRSDGTVINKAGGTITGGTNAPSYGTDNASGVYIGGSNATLENAGTIGATLGDAVDLSASGTNRVIVDAGAVFEGNVVAKAGAANTLELSGTYGPGTIDGIGTQFQNFQTLTIDSGAQWDIGSISGTATIENAGTIGENSTVGLNIGTDDATVINTGSITGTYSGIVFGNGGSLLNAAGGIITGGNYGVAGLGDQVTIENAGTITGTSGVAVFLEGSIENRLIVDAGAVFNGIVAAIPTADNTLELSAGATAGTISGIGYQYQGFQTVTIDSGAQWDVGGIAGRTTVVNSGTVGANSSVGIKLEDGGVVINNQGGTITGAGNAGITINNINAADTPSTIDNSGSISGYTGVYFTRGAGDGTVINRDTGSIYGQESGIRMYDVGTVTNSGTIAGGYGIWLRHGGGAVINNQGGTIQGVSDGVVVNHTAASIDNSGIISATGTNGYGVVLTAGGTVTNTATGTISGGYVGVEIVGEGTITNAGTITGAGAFADGIDLRGPATVDNTGLVSGAYGIFVEEGGTIVNGAGGTIVGSLNGIMTLGGDYALTIENAGTIAGLNGDSVDMGAYTNRLIVDAGAVFVGNVQANGTSNTLELNAGATPGTITGLGSQYSGFTDIQIDHGGTWTVAGTIDGFEGNTDGKVPTIHGFDEPDRLNLTDLGYTSDNSFSLSNSDVLTIFEDGAAVATIQLAGDFTGDFFHLTDNHDGGSYVTEDDNPVCYCRGTMIRTDRGEIAVEGLRIGDRVITASGQAKPIRWIGRRSYSGKFAGNNPNILPICFKEGSLAHNVPRRDLFVSPEHAMFIGGVLVPARHLVNGDSVFQASRTDLVEYFHIELDRHDVIVAEGALSETYADDDNRGRFHNATEFRRLYPEHAKKRGARYCAPRLEDGDEVERARIAIAARAVQLAGSADSEAAA